MLVQLSLHQARVIGVLLEKEVTTPDQYPLSLNALTLGCNQKSNREPVMSLDESEVQNVIDELRDMKLVMDYHTTGSRVVKYQHRFCNTEFSDLKFSRQQLAIVCVLLLRGSQTPGELRTRTNRLADFNHVDEVEETLTTLQALNGEQLVTKLSREPGKRESRYAHFFCGEPTLPTHSESLPITESVPQQPESETNLRIEQLENQLAELTKQVSELKDLVDIMME